MVTYKKQGSALSRAHVMESIKRPEQFLRNFLELQIPMVLGAFVCYLLNLLVISSSRFVTVYHPGTYLFTAGDVFFLTIPVLVWMIIRDHGRRYSMEMAAAMVIPVVLTIVIGRITGYASLLWLVNGMYPVMCLGMLVTMLRRHEGDGDLVSNSIVIKGE